MPWKGPCPNALFMSTISVVATPRKACADLDGISRRTSAAIGSTARRDSMIKTRLPSRHFERELAHQSFGPKKVMDRLRALEPDEVWPADSTAGKILKRNHLVRERRQRRRVPPGSAGLGPLAPAELERRLQGRRTPGQREAPAHRHAASSCSAGP